MKVYLDKDIIPYVETMLELSSDFLGLVLFDHSSVQVTQPEE